MINQRGFISGFLLFSLHLSAMAELPQYSDEAHLGVASCASGVCHGSVNPRSSTSVLQNEYVIWSRLDRHKNAYNTLLSAQSKKIALNLGLKNAYEADICLDCHADNVAVAKRGPKFQIEDGVGCEACHGGAEKYVSSHTDEAVSRDQNLKKGLYATDQLPQRATLCFSCHMGNERKIASHEIMGAGHPRLSFELDTFGILQPAHYVVDAKYSEEKWAGSSLTTWALGQVEAGRQTLGLIESKLNSKKLFPELSLFDCHACHHVMSQKRWQQRERIQLPPGSVRLNDAGFLMLFPIARVYAPSLHDDLHANLRELHKRVNDGSKIGGVKKRLEKVFDTITESIISSDTNQSAPEVLNEIITMGAAGQFRDYVAAEQAVMAIDMLLSAVGKRDDQADWLDSLYDSVEEEDRYDPGRLAALIDRYDSGL